MSILTRLGWEHAKVLAYKATRCGNHEAKTYAELQTRSGDFVQKVSVIEGQHDVDGQGRRCEAMLARTGDLGVQTIPLEEFLRLCLATWDGTYVPDWGWCWVPTHNGPITSADPGDAVVKVNARGADDLLTNNLLEDKTVLQGHPTVNAVRTALVDWCGINPKYVKLPSMRHTIPKDRTWPRSTPVRRIIEDLAESVNTVLRMDANRTTLMRPFPTNISFDWYDAVRGAGSGNPVSIVSPPVRQQTARDSSGDYLPSWLVGVGHKGMKPQEWFADPKSPISKETLALDNGTDVVEQAHRRLYTNVHIRDEALMQERLSSLGVQYEELAQDVAFEGKVMPFMEYQDRQAAHAERFEAEFTLGSFSFPMAGGGDDGTQTVGYTQIKSWASARVRNV